MTPAQGSATGDGRGKLHARVEDIRHSLAITTDPGARSRLRIRLADLLSGMGDVQSAVGELRQAIAEGPPSAGMLSCVRVVAGLLPRTETDALMAAIRIRRAPRQVSGTTAPRRSPRSGHATEDTAAAVRGLPAALPPRIAPLPASSSPETPVSADPIKLAFAALAEGKPIRARRLGEEAARAGGFTVAVPGRVGELVAALDQAGAKREGLRLSRTLAEDESARGAHDALAAVIRRAADVGETDLASRWSADLEQSFAPSGSHGGARSLGPTPSTLVRFREAQRLALVAILKGGDFDAAIARLAPLLGGHAGGADALAVAERLVLDANGARIPGSSVEMLRMAFEAENSPRRRQRLAVRWANALKETGDRTAALAVLSRAIEALPPDASPELRRLRADWLRTEGRESDLCRVIEDDAQVAKGPARQELLAELARLLDGQGDFDAALDVRLRALVDSPGDLGLLGPVRQRLESTGRLDRSLEVATAALPHVHVKDRLHRAGLLRDIATLAEATAGDHQRASAAWHEVLSLVPGDAVALDAAERLFRQVGDSERLGGLLSSWAAQEVEPAARGKVLWRLAEFRRSEQQTPFAALALYREIVASGVGNVVGLSFADEDWQRRDDFLAVHTARALAAPGGSETARALADRAELLIAADRWEEADRDLERALDLDPTVVEVLRALERLYERRGDLRTLRKRLTARVESATGAAAARLWFGIGHANSQLGDLPAAVAAYEQATLADVTFRPPITMLRELAAARGDFLEAAHLLEKELSVSTVPADRVGLSVELGVLLTTRLDAAPRAVEILDAVLVLEPRNTAVLEAMFGAALAAGSWEKAIQALDILLAAGLAPADASQRYHRLGLAAEKAGQVDRALGFYSRSYARNPAFRPTLERLSEICFERQQWENAWKATEHLIERHGADLDPDARADLALRSALSDLHVAQRLVAATRITAMVVGPVSQAALRDLADSWASMRFEPRLLAGVEGDRRSRALSRLTEVFALTSKNPGHPARSLARETLAALAVVERRWGDALAALDAFGEDDSLESHRRCLFLVSAGDILLQRQGDVAGAALRYQRARGLNPQEPRLARGGIAQLAGGERGTEMEDQGTPTPAPIRRS